MKKLLKLFQKKQVQYEIPNEPYFWEDRIAKLPICVELLKNYKTIKEEVEAFIKTPEILQDYPKYKVFDKELYDVYWKAFPLSNFDGEYVEFDEEQHEFIKELASLAKLNCPTIQKIISGLEADGKVANVFVSKLIPGSIINEHHGWSDKWMRVHLGLICDEECKITVGKETKAWKEGKLLAFKDGGPYLHSVRHNGKSERIILSIDISLDYIQTFLKK